MTRLLAARRTDQSAGRPAESLAAAFEPHQWLREFCKRTRRIRDVENDAIGGVADGKAIVFQVHQARGQRRNEVHAQIKAIGSDLRDICIKIRHSEILRLASGLVQPTTGAVIVGGREVAAKALRIGMAFQNPTMLPWLTIEQNVMLPLKLCNRSARSIASKGARHFATKPTRCLPR